MSAEYPKVIGVIDNTFLIQLDADTGRLFSISADKQRVFSPASIESILMRSPFNPVPEDIAADVLDLYLQSEKGLRQHRVWKGILGSFGSPVRKEGWNPNEQARDEGGKFAPEGGGEGVIADQHWKGRENQVRGYTSEADSSSSTANRTDKPVDHITARHANIDAAEQARYLAEEAAEASNRGLTDKYKKEALSRYEAGISHMKASGQQDDRMEGWAKEHISELSKLKVRDSGKKR